MSTAALILVVVTVWGLMSFVMVVFASMLSSRISRQEEKRALAGEWRQRGAMGFSMVNTAAEHEMADLV